MNALLRFLTGTNTPDECAVIESGLLAIFIASVLALSAWRAWSGL